MKARKSHIYTKSFTESTGKTVHVKLYLSVRVIRSPKFDFVEIKKLYSFKIICFNLISLKLYLYGILIFKENSADSSKSYVTHCKLCQYCLCRYRKLYQLYCFRWWNSMFYCTLRQGFNIKSRRFQKITFELDLLNRR